MLSLIKIDLKRVIRSSGFYIALFLILTGSFVTLKRNMILQNLILYKSVGSLNLFIYSSIKNNVIMTVLAPLVASLPFGTGTYDDIKSGFLKNIIPYSTPVVYIKSKMLSTALIGGGIFVITYTFLLLAFFVADPTTSVRFSMSIGILLSVYYRSLLLYCIFFIVHCFIFGAVYSLFSMGISLVIRNKYVAIALPTIIYYISVFFISTLPDYISSKLLYLCPFLTFEITATSTPLVQNITQQMFILVIALLLINMGYKRYRISN